MPAMIAVESVKVYIDILDGFYPRFLEEKKAEDCLYARAAFYLHMKRIVLKEKKLGKINQDRICIELDRLIVHYREASKRELLRQFAPQF